MSQSLTSLYRDYLRAVRQLPHIYLRQFYRIKASDDIRSALARPVTAHCRVKRIAKDIRRIKAATSGSNKAFAHILDVAYGRKGKLRWELMEPLLTDHHASPPEPMFPGKPDSRPPIYSPELKALLTSSCSRVKPLSERALRFPPLLSPRADPKSEEARLLGPLSKRRELNFRWRYFVSEWKKVRPPLNISPSSTYNGEERSTFGFHGLQLFEEIEALAAQDPNLKRGPRRERNSSCHASPVHVDSPSPTPRWLRRRYRELLSRVPILTRKQPSKFFVSSSPLAWSSERFKAPFMSEVDDGDIAWMMQAEEYKQPKEVSKNDAKT
ncbi:hypothetical protein EYR36_007603 [Pleurotus pulmonarius]|nr:hypothetical protein EYR36_007603 [Pleurotus pulmonarius]